MKKGLKKRVKKKRNKPNVIHIKSESSSQILENSNNSRYYKESNYHNREIVHQHQQNSKKEIEEICDRHSLRKDLLRLLVNLEYDLELHNIIKVNQLACNYHHHRD